MRHSLNYIWQSRCHRQTYSIAIHACARMHSHTHHSMPHACTHANSHTCTYTHKSFELYATTGVKPFRNSFVLLVVVLHQFTQLYESLNHYLAIDSGGYLCICISQKLWRCSIELFEQVCQRVKVKPLL